MRARYALAAGLVLGVLATAASLVARPLDGGAVTKARSAPIDVGEYDVHTQAVSISKVHLLGTDPTNPARGDWTQSIRVTNRHATNSLCIKPVTFATDCSTSCTGATLTCNGSSSDGDYVGAGTSLTIPISGRLCLCGIASGSGTTTTAARVQRYPD